MQLHQSRYIREVPVVSHAGGFPVLSMMCVEKIFFGAWGMRMILVKPSKLFSFYLSVFKNFMADDMARLLAKLRLHPCKLRANPVCIDRYANSPPHSANLRDDDFTKSHLLITSTYASHNRSAKLFMSCKNLPLSHPEGILT